MTKKRHAVPISLKTIGNKIIVIPVENLIYNSRYVIEGLSGLKNSIGKGVVPFNVEFTTENPFRVIDTVSSTQLIEASTVTISFSHSINPETLSRITFKAGEDDIEFTPSVVCNKIILTASLEYETEYTITIPTTVRSTDNKALVTEEVYTFITQVAYNPLEVVNYSSGDNILIDSNITVEFNNDIQEPIDNTMIWLQDELSIKVSCVLFVVGSVITLNPVDDLEYNKVYDIRTSELLKDTYDQSLETQVSLLFTTETPPVFEVSSTIPDNESPGVIIDTDITIILSNNIQEPIDDTMVWLEDNLSIKVSCVLSVEDNVITLSPNSNLNYGIEYTIKVSTLLKDIYNQTLDEYSSTFNTINLILTLLTPTIDEEVEENSEYEITWSYENITDTIKIEFWNGTSYEVLSATQDKDIAFYWNVNSGANPDAKIKITADGISDEHEIDVIAMNNQIDNYTGGIELSVQEGQIDNYTGGIELSIL